MAEEYDYLFKSIVVGDGGVGKTALTLRFSKGFFTEDYKMTIGVDFHVKTISIDSNEGPIRSKLQIWDTGGQERFSSIRPMYYRGSLGALLIFDLTNSSSFEHLPQWIEEIRANVKTEIPLLLLGNKSDLVDQRAVSLEEINTFTRDFNLFYMETSAKTGEGVGDCFYILACLMIGSGVPDQLLSKDIVFNPGEILPNASSAQVPTSPQVQTGDDYSAPPVPEPFSTVKQDPVFEPEPEFDYSAPPVPEPPNKSPSNLSSSFESETEPEISIPEPTVEGKPKTFTEFEFKTQDEILAEEELESSPNEPMIESPEETSSISSKEAYSPKAAPFTTNIPVPAPAPEGFHIDQAANSSESSPPTPAPFLATNEPPSVKPSSLVDYTSKPFYSKKDSKKKEKLKQKEEKEQKLREEKERQQKLAEDIKREKQKKKEEKERKLQEEKDRQQKLIEDMKNAKKGKSKKQKKENLGSTNGIILQSTPKPISASESPNTPSLFQTLAKKEVEPENAQTGSFVPFSKTGKTQNQEKSKLRIIPNSTEIETKPSSFTPIQSVPKKTKKKSSSSDKKEFIICNNCGARLSSDYTFCNKCGSQL